jgi:uncharacterized protein (TIGR03083 family)
VTHPYDVARRQFTAIVRDAAATTVVPACPDWTVQDLLAHQVHQLSGASDGSFPAADSIERLSGANASTRHTAEERQEAWIRSGVAEWSTRSTRELLQAWSQLSNTAPREVLDALVPDVVVHLVDLQGAVGVSGARDDALVSRALEFWASIAGVAVPGGADERFELLRVITGRRSRSQAPDIGEAVALYGWREDDLVE